MHHVEKRALLYVASNPALATSHRIKDLAHKAVTRMSRTETRILLPHLFDPYTIDWTFGNDNLDLATSFVFLQDSARVVRY